MSRKKITFKQRIRKNDQKQRHNVASGMRKRMGVGRRNANRFDQRDNGSRSMEELMSEITRGVAIPSQESDLDPRSLTNLLLRPVPTPAAPSAAAAEAAAERGAKQAAECALSSQTKAAAAGRPVLPTTLPQDDPRALPDMHVIEEEERRRQLEQEATAAQPNKNQYRHHGQPYVFWERVGVHPLLLQALRTLKFTHPTPVQEEVLPSVLRQTSSSEAVGNGAKKKKKGTTEEPKDVVVSAETGSGKTLVFALPILNDVLNSVLGASRSEAEEAGASTSAKQSADVASTATHGTRSKRGRTAEADESRSSAAAGAPALKKASVGGSGTAVRVAPSEFNRRLMHTLVISPTRELALQINDAMKQLVRFAPQITIGCVVGGMAAEKQQRVLNRHPHILICTPGRLWELVQKNEGCYLGHSISRRLHYVVLDEADKLLQSGRFEELKTLLERIHSELLPAGFTQEREEGAEAGEIEMEAGRWDDKTQSFRPFTAEEKAARAMARDAAAAGLKKEASADQADKLHSSSDSRQHSRDAEEAEETEADEEESAEDDGSEDAAGGGDEAAGQRARGKKDQPHPIPMPAEPSQSHRVITYVTSATLSLQTNYERKDFKSQKSIIRTSNADVMGKVLQELDIKPSMAQVFAVSQTPNVAAKINETYLRCPDDSKDLYLYYFLRTYRGDRSIIFVNAISMLRRLVKLIDILGIPVVGLHASMQQRQRLKFIDKFKSGDIRVLVATDVASRGLDIDGLKYVVHYQVPRSTDAYIHRCGRTARCGGAGLSVLMVNATEHMSFRKLMESLGRRENEMEVFALQPTVVHQLHAHLKIALQIDKLQKEIDKSRATNTWVTRMSKSAELEVDDMLDDEAANENREKLKAIKVLKKQLDLITRKFTGSYGGKGAFRTGAQALGANQAEQKLRERASRQALLHAKKGGKK